MPSSPQYHGGDDAGAPPCSVTSPAAISMALYPPWGDSLVHEGLTKLKARHPKTPLGRAGEALGGR